MRKTVGLGEDNFQTLIEENHFFIDKTLFVYYTLKVKTLETKIIDNKKHV